MKRPPKKPAVSVRAETYARLEAEAEKRGLTAARLLERLLSEVAP